MTYTPLCLAFCVQHNYLGICPRCFISSCFLLLLSLEMPYNLFICSLPDEHLDCFWV